MPDGASVVLNASIVSMKGMPAFSVYMRTKAAVRWFCADVVGGPEGPQDPRQRRQPRP